jgi:hypothetical protein
VKEGKCSVLLESNFKPIPHRLRHNFDFILPSALLQSPMNTAGKDKSPDEQAEDKKCYKTTN